MLTAHLFEWKIPDGALFKFKHRDCTFLQWEINLSTKIHLDGALCQRKIPDGTLLEKTGQLTLPKKENLLAHCWEKTSWRRTLSRNIVQAKKLSAHFSENKTPGVGALYQTENSFSAHFVTSENPSCALSTKNKNLCWRTFQGGKNLAVPTLSRHYKSWRRLVGK